MFSSYTRSSLIICHFLATFCSCYFSIFSCVLYMSLDYLTLKTSLNIFLRLCVYLWKQFQVLFNSIEFLSWCLNLFLKHLITFLMIFKLLLQYKLECSKDQNWKSTCLKVINIEYIKMPVIFNWMKCFLVINFRFSKRKCII